jgi:spermidine/putrescine-binding protein
MVEEEDDPVNRSSKVRWSRLMVPIAIVAMLASACSSSGATSAPSASGGAAAVKCTAPTGTVHVPIVNKDMSPDDVKAAIQAEGTLTVGNWTYAATDELVKQFQQCVKDAYGVDIKLNYVGSQAPSEYITKLSAAKQANSPAPYDVLAIEENYWYDASSAGLVDSFLPSGLVPNQKLVIDSFQHVPESIAFQSTAYPGVVYNKKNAPWLKSLKDLADPRLKGKVTLPAPGDITAGGFLLGVASELGKDYKDPAQMKEVVDWVVTNIGPNVVKYTTDQPTLQKLFESGAVDAVGFWNSLARLEYLGGHPDAALLVPQTIYPANGYLWIPKNAAHPVLAQVFINWRLNPDVQFPNAWPIDHGQWSELSEGFLGPDYTGLVPDWFKADYFTYFPTLDQIKTSFKPIDWKAYNASAAVFQDYYKQKIGQ